MNNDEYVGTDFYANMNDIIHFNNNVNPDFDLDLNKISYDEVFDIDFDVYDEDYDFDEYVRESKNSINILDSQKFMYENNKNLCSGYFCSFIPLTCKNTTQK